IDPNSAMRAAAFQLIRNVLHACGTVIALRPEDNVAAASVEIVEASISSKHLLDHIAHRCKIPAVVSEIRIEAAERSASSEHQLLGDLIEAQAAQITARASESIDPAAAPQAGAVAAAAAGSSAVAAVTESSLRVEAARIDAVMNLVGELIIGKSMLNRTL